MLACYIFLKLNAFVITIEVELDLWFSITCNLVFFLNAENNLCLNFLMKEQITLLFIHQFCRTISTKHLQTSDVRPLPVLEDTLSYLLKVADSADHPFEVVHDFIFDRTRSIRQDMSMQNIVNDKAIYMYEKMVLFFFGRNISIFFLNLYNQIHYLHKN